MTQRYDGSTDGQPGDLSGSESPFSDIASQRTTISRDDAGFQAGMMSFYGRLGDVERVRYPTSYQTTETMMRETSARVAAAVSPAVDGLSEFISDGSRVFHAGSSKVKRSGTQAYRSLVQHVSRVHNAAHDGLQRTVNRLEGDIERRRRTLAEAIKSWPGAIRERSIGRYDDEMGMCAAVGRQVRERALRHAAEQRAARRRQTRDRLSDMTARVKALRPWSRVKDLAASVGRGAAAFTGAVYRTGEDVLNEASRRLVSMQMTATSKVHRTVAGFRDRLKSARRGIGHFIVDMPTKRQFYGLSATAVAGLAVVAGTVAPHYAQALHAAAMPAQAAITHLGAQVGHISSAIDVSAGLDAASHAYHNVMMTAGDAVARFSHDVQDFGRHALDVSDHGLMHDYAVDTQNTFNSVMDKVTHQGLASPHVAHLAQASQHAHLVHPGIVADAVPDAVHLVVPEPVHQAALHADTAHQVVSHSPAATGHGQGALSSLRHDDALVQAAYQHVQDNSADVLNGQELARLKAGGLHEHMMQVAHNLAGADGEALVQTTHHAPASSSHEGGTVISHFADRITGGISQNYEELKETFRHKMA